MLKFIKSGIPFGKIIVDVCAIKFQKRGIPHTHILIWLASEFKCKTTDDVDSFVSTEMPHQNIDPLYHEIVPKFIMHGPWVLQGQIHNACQEIYVQSHFQRNSGAQLFWAKMDLSIIDDVDSMIILC
uniref:Helitron helicase-like domain-containing protein n=1 Tax=Salix viminalis TaxID=40686 RepID=A0A6N2KLL2_SALVM